MILKDELNKKKLKYLNIKLSKEIGKVTYISPIPTKNDLLWSLVFKRLIFLLVLIFATYLAYDYISSPYYTHLPILKQMNDGRVVNIEVFRFFIYIIAIVFSLKRLLFLSKSIKVVGDKGIAIYIFRFSRKYSVPAVIKFQDRDFKINKFIKNELSDDFVEALTSQYTSFKHRG